jgi:signal transduction histidine kinase
MSNNTPFDVTIIMIAGTTALSLLIFYLITFFILYQRRQTQNLKEKASLKAQYQQEILQSQLEIQNQTLQRVGQELHDNIGQLLTLARMQLNLLETEPTITQHEIAPINDLIMQSINEVRALSKGLDGDFVQNFGLVESLSHELQRIRQVGKYQTEIEVAGEVVRLEGQKEIILFRIAQEILNNALKHASAKSIKAKLSYSATQLLFRIEDDGKGFDSQEMLGREMSKAGAGLRNIQRRAELLGGNCQIESIVGKGTLIELQIPIS